MTTPSWRAAAALTAASLWLVGLFLGLAGHGLVHLLLAAALWLFPWRTARRP